MMNKHGMAIGLERSDNDIYLTLKMQGTLTHQDYQRLTPMIDSALQNSPERCLKVYVDITELEGWQAQALWDDFKFGIKHNKNFSKIALLGNEQWQHVAAKVGNWFISGELQYFADSQKALEWLHQ